MSKIRSKSTTSRRSKNALKSLPYSNVGASPWSFTTGLYTLCQIISPEKS